MKYNILIPYSQIGVTTMSEYLKARYRIEVCEVRQSEIVDNNGSIITLVHVLRCCSSPIKYMALKLKEHYKTINYEGITLI